MDARLVDTFDLCDGNFHAFMTLCHALESRFSTAKTRLPLHILVADSWQVAAARFFEVSALAASWIDICIHETEHQMCQALGLSTPLANAAEQGSYQFSVLFD